MWLGIHGNFGEIALPDLKKGDRVTQNRPDLHPPVGIRVVFLTQSQGLAADPTTEYQEKYTIIIMSANAAKKTSYRISEKNHRIIREEIVEFGDVHVNYLDEFIYLAVKNQGPEIRTMISGRWIANRLIHLLNEIGRIQAPIQDQSVSSILNNDAHVEIDLALNRTQRRCISDISTDSDLSKSQVIQCYIIKQLFDVSYYEHALTESPMHSIGEQWADLLNCMDGSRHDLHHALAKFFFHHDHTYYLFNEDREAFIEFAEAYFVDFYESDLYQDLEEIYGRDVLDEVECVIQKGGKIDPVILPHNEYTLDSTRRQQEIESSKCSEGSET